VSPNRIERERGLQERGGVGAGGVDEHLVSLVSPASFPAEQYRALRHIVEQMHRDGALQVAAVTSPAPGDGKTTTAINLAGALAQAPEARVLLIDADLRRPSVDLRRLSVGVQLGGDDSGRPGLVEALLDPTVSLEDAVRLYPPFNLAVLPAGRSPDRPYEVLKSPRLEELLKEARRRYDFVVVDTPPVVVVPDSRIIAKWLDGFLLVVAAHKTPLKLVEEAVNLLDADKVIGIVFNQDDRPLSGYYGDYYGYAPSSRHDRVGWWARVAEKIRGSTRLKGTTKSGRRLE
jgi:capsular exopolysaccharide synthesis family protein